MHTPNISEVQFARKAFREREPRDLFYRVATELIELSIRKVTTLSVAEALAVLLQTWNKNFYRFSNDFSEKHLKDIEGLLDSSWKELSAFRQRSIDSFNASDEPIVIRLFTRSEHVLGPVGTAKCLHLLAPEFFPLWDREITKAYHIWLKAGPCNAKLYLRFMGYSKQQYDALRKEGESSGDLLKALDEYNYWTFTLKGNP